jgi:hypothetical protein
MARHAQAELRALDHARTRDDQEPRGSRLGSTDRERVHASRAPDRPARAPLFLGLLARVSLGFAIGSGVVVVSRRAPALERGTHEVHEQRMRIVWA